MGRYGEKSLMQYRSFELCNGRYVTVWRPTQQRTGTWKHWMPNIILVRHTYCTVQTEQHIWAAIGSSRKHSTNRLQHLPSIAKFHRLNLIILCGYYFSLLDLLLHYNVLYERTHKLWYKCQQVTCIQESGMVQWLRLMIERSGFDCQRQ